MESVKVFSPVDDKNIKNDLKNSPIWKEAYTEDEVVMAMKKNSEMFEYNIKFDGLNPIQFAGVKKLVK